MNPWDRIALPIYEPGDLNDDVTYAAIGRCVCAWEEIEVELSHLYSIFVGKPHESDAIREYGQGRISADRIRNLELKAEAFFIKRPNQEVEGKFCEIIATVRGYADRRNELSHGAVRMVRRKHPSPDGKMYYLLLPSHYDYRRHDEKNVPTFAYSSENLLVLNERMFWVARTIEEFATELLPEDER